MRRTTLPASIHFIPFSKEECIIGCPPLTVPLPERSPALSCRHVSAWAGRNHLLGGWEGGPYIGSQWWELENPCQSVSLLPSL
ncbi:hypothetical protein AVEN_37733-1 [Araneus ventricosus]|uniref:Uncharacterized protein n=1 Tax=Araneus ventricosus TaxID=182803 RepID=A0A4Y2BU75_ARAVE|nr:hypothetical protein AVEN_37733-1 [Araneus ventricosus]